MQLTSKLLVSRTFTPVEKDLMKRIVEGKDINAFVKLYRDKIIMRRKSGRFHTPCWQWCAHGSPDGYGQVKIEGKKQTVSRYVWQLVNGPIPMGSDGKTMEVDHLCRTPSCFNPDHLQLITSTENKQLIKIRRDEDKSRALQPQDPAA